MSLLRRRMMAVGESEPKTNIIHCVYRATVDDIDEYGGVILFEERFDISQVDWIRVWYDDVTEETFDSTVDDILFLPLSPGDWRIDIKVNNLTNCHGMFAYTGLLSADFSEVDISMITNCDYMFYHCDKLIKSPFDVLPIKELTAGCCEFMFQECSNLTKAPELPASILVDECYSCMFYGCQKLNYIKMLATDISAYNCLNGWVYNVSPTGTFVKNENATWDTTPGALGISGVPAGWTVVNDGEESDIDFGIEFPLYIEADDCIKSNNVFRDCYSNSLGATFYTNLFNFAMHICKTYGEFNDYYYVDLSLLDIHIFVDVNGEWSEIEDFYADKDFTYIEGFHKLGGEVYNYVSLYNDKIQWGYI